ncbi:PaaI family thioesterase [uncultured Pseudoteredinibacter sp.]|uniref:PaaI family thioesterase n=1 Tax=uncultured Pseudoteredinibacter sp. TaxID=1641701 RepID=UPI00261E4F34|nr:PaaI family thioesterase [uncultured Pseudoteredinibacter sp.]
MSTEISSTNSNFERLRASFNQQNAMKTLGIGIESVSSGHIELHMPYQPSLCQQHGFIHAGITTAALDSACGYAAFTQMPEGSGILTVEFKTTLLAPAKGEYFIYRGELIRAGRQLYFSQAKAFAIHEGKESCIATMSATLMCIQGREEIKN